MTSLGGTIIPVRDKIGVCLDIDYKGKRTELDNDKGQRGWESWKQFR